MKKILILLVLLLILGTGWYFWARQDEDKVSYIEKVSDLTETQILNGSAINPTGTLVNLNDGKYIAVPKGDDSQAYDAISIAEIALGDINGDGLGDAVAITNSYCGAGICGTALAVWINDKGEPHFLTSTKIGYRPYIESLTINNDTTISVEMNPDPGNISSANIRANFKLEADKIVSTLKFK